MSQIKVINSLTNKKDTLIPIENKKLKWYLCGPTVYDSAHLGHARNYLGFDILNRILTNYFGYEIHSVMNITDIDDKIIVRSHYQRLKYLIKTIKKNNIETNGNLEIAENINEFEIKKIYEYNEILKNFIPDFKDFDIQTKFMHLSRKYEKQFFEDMEKLEINKAKVITRVSEYIPKIIDYIKVIIDNGYAYISDHDIYFDTENFKNNGYLYPKSITKTSNESLEQDEGVLFNSKNKKNPKDFVLWKKSKQNEPKWDSPWGYGRPGWHIECSVMCSDTLGSNVDINSGGIDLKFPHHDNQIAQCESYFQCKKWVNYFLHSGHLHIDKMKMSKSLKNFITIKDCLKNYTSRQIRLFFATYKFNDNVDISIKNGKIEQLNQIIILEKNIIDFLLNCQVILRRNDLTNGFHDKESIIIQRFYKITKEIHTSLCNSFDTPKVIKIIFSLIEATNLYIKKSKPKMQINQDVIESIMNFILNILNSMGLQFKVYNLYDTDIVKILDFSMKIREECRKYFFCVKNNIELHNFIFPELNDNESTLLKDLLIKFMSELEKYNDRNSIIQICDQFRKDLLNQNIQIEDDYFKKGESVWKLL